jgi:NAD(P)-dependent dehydrogenase (short-subunit alcohol dehydrogenase family)
VNDPRPGNDLFTVADKVVVLTGGLGKLGQVFSRALVERGARVAVFDLVKGPPPADSPAGDRFVALDVDVTDRRSLERGLAEVRGRWGEPDGLVNNAAIDSPPDAPASENGPFESFPESSFDRVMAVNVKGVHLACQVVGGALAQAGRGSIVNISSIYGLVSPDQRIYGYRQQGEAPFFKPVAYSVSKSALLNLTRYLATYWAPRGVRVNTLTFAGVFNNQDPQFLEGYCAHVPLGRMARAEEYRAPLIYLLSDGSSYMTGANLVVDGGWTAW